MSRPKNVPDISVSEVLEMMQYNSDGTLTWKIKRGPCPIGQRVGTVTNGRLQTCIKNTRVYVANVVWFIHHGYFPAEKEMIVDHIDGDPMNNRIENLRICSFSENRMNSKPRKDKSQRGVFTTGEKFYSIIGKGKKLYHLGTFETEAEAAAAYQGASRVLHGEFSVFNRQDACFEE